MRVAVFSSKRYERQFLEQNPGVLKDSNAELEFMLPRLDESTAPLAAGYDAICVFVNDVVSETVLEKLSAGGTHCVLLRCAGFNNVDLTAAKRLGVRVLRVPTYSPHAVAEFAAALLLAVNRKTHRAYARVRDGNFALYGLMGFDIHEKTVGVVGTGAIGKVFCKIMLGFSARVIAYDLYPSQEMKDAGVEYVQLEELLSQSDIISLHCPLLPSTKHIIDETRVSKMKKGVVLINVSRGELIETDAVIKAVQDGTIAGLGMDVYEGEGDLFFDDHSGETIHDERLSVLLMLPQVGDRPYPSVSSLHLFKPELTIVCSFLTGAPHAPRGFQHRHGHVQHLGRDAR